MRDLKILAAAVVCFFLLIACSGPAANKATNTSGGTNANSGDAPPAPSQAGTINGKQLYTENCMICHRDTAKGGELTMRGKRIRPADLTKSALKTWNNDKWLHEVEEGDPDEGMPPFKEKLKPEEIKAIVDYLRSLG